MTVYVVTDIGNISLEEFNAAPDKSVYFYGDINYAIGKCFSCGKWLGGKKDKYCEEHEARLTLKTAAAVKAYMDRWGTGTALADARRIQIIINNPLDESNWEEIVEENIIPAINDAKKRREDEDS